MTRATILTRISVDADASDSVERQESELRLLAARLGADVVAVHTDRGVSGASTKRPALDAWLSDAEHGRAELLLAWDWSRISRTGLRSVARVLDVLDSSGARLVTLRDNLDSASPAFGIITAVMAETARAERDAIRDRVSSRQAADRARGRWIKPAPFGYRVADGRLVPDEQAPILRDLVLRYIGGESFRSLVAMMNASGVKPPRADTWGVSSLRHIITSPSSAGMIPHKGDVVRSDNGEPIIVADPPVISLAEHRAALDRTKVNPQRKGSRPAEGVRHPLSGLVRCACGSPMVYQSRAGTGRQPRFRCAAPPTAGAPGCSTAQAHLLLEQVRGLVLSEFGSRDVEDAWLGEVAIRLGYAEQPSASAEIAAALEEIAEVEALLADAEDARFSGRGFRGQEGKARFDALVDALTERLQRAQRVAQQQAPVIDLGAMTDPALWDGAVTDSLRSLMLASVKVAVVSDGQVLSVEYR